MFHENDRSEAAEEDSDIEGRYANYFKVGYNAVEFLFDFGQFYPEGEKAQLHTRIITGPVYAKALLETLRESLDRYEQTFGTVGGDWPPIQVPGGA